MRFLLAIISVILLVIGLDTLIAKLDLNLKMEKLQQHELASGNGNELGNGATKTTG